MTGIWPMFTPLPLLLPRPVVVEKENLMLFPPHSTFTVAWPLYPLYVSVPCILAYAM